MGNRSLRRSPVNGAGVGEAVGLGVALALAGADVGGPATGRTGAYRLTVSTAVTPAAANTRVAVRLSATIRPTRPLRGGVGGTGGYAYGATGGYLNAGSAGGCPYPGWAGGYAGIGVVGGAGGPEGVGASGCVMAIPVCRCRRCAIIGRCPSTRCPPFGSIMRLDDHDRGDHDDSLIIAGRVSARWCRDRRSG